VYKKDAPIDEVTVLNIPGTTAHTHTHGRNLHANDFLKFHYVQGGGDFVFCFLFFPGRLEQLKIIKRKKKDNKIMLPSGGK
jgi:hypothetical protein